MKVKVFGQPVEPCSMLLAAVFIWIGFTIGTVIVIAWVVVGVASALFNAPALLLARKGRH